MLVCLKTSPHTPPQAFPQNLLPTNHPLTCVFLSVVMLKYISVHLFAFNIHYSTPVFPRVSYPE